MKKKPLVVALSVLLPAITATTVSAADYNTGRITPSGPVTDKYSGNASQHLGDYVINNKANGRSIGSTFVGNGYQDIVSRNPNADGIIYSKDDVFTGKTAVGWSQIVEGGTVSHATFNDGAIQDLGDTDSYPEHNHLSISTSVNSVFNNSMQIIGGGTTSNDPGSFDSSWQGVSSGDTFNGKSSQMARGTGKVEHAQLHDSSVQTLQDSATSTGSVFSASSIQNASGNTSSRQDTFQDHSEQVLNGSAQAKNDTFSGHASQQLNGKTMASNNTFSENSSQNLNSPHSHSENESFYEQSAQNIKAGASTGAAFYNNAVLQMSGGSSTGAIFNNSSRFNVQSGAINNATLNDNATGLLGGEGVATGTTLINDHASLTIVARPTFDPVSRQAERVMLNGGTLDVSAPAGNNPNPVAATVRDLAVNGGIVQFTDTHPDANGHFIGLNVDTLSGSGGTLAFNASLADAKSNVLTARTIGPGHYHLRINDASDSKALTLKTLEEGSKLNVIHATTQGGDQATYDLVDINGKKIDSIDLGLHLGDLGKDDKGNVIIRTITNKTTRSTDALLGALSSGLFISDGEMQSVRSRRGELQNGAEDSGGVWGRYLNGNTHVHAAGTAAYRLEQNGMELGGDKIINVGDDRLALGVFGSYSKNKLKQDRGNSSNVDSWGAGVYATWFGSQGYYVDSVLKYNRFSTTVRSQTETGLGVNGDFDQNGLGASLETGYRFNLPASVFIEPYVRADWFSADGKTVTLSNGLEAKADRLQSIRGEAGVSAGKSFDLNGGMTLSPYVTVAVEHEFDKSNEVRMNDAYNFNNDFSGTTGRYGLGVTSQLTRNASVYLEANYRKGEHVESPVMGNAGFRVSF